MYFYERLRYARRISGLKGKEIADKIRVAPGSYSQYETGKREPDIMRIKALAEVLNVTGDFLIGLVDNPNERYNPSGKKTDTLAADEEQLLTNYNKLNPTGKDKVQDYTEDLTDNEKYTNTNLKPLPFSKSELPAEPEYRIAAWGGKETKSNDQPPLEENKVY